MKQLIRAFGCVVAVWLPVSFAAAQPLDRASHPYVRATADATVSVPPDRARLTIGVVSQAGTAQAAAAQNASQTESMVTALRRSLGSSAELHTSGYSLNPEFTYAKPGGKPVISGYTASNTVEITTDDLAKVGKVIDAGTQAGGNNVRGIEFLLKDETPVRARALHDAALKARASADAMAGALGLKVARVLSAEEGEPQVIRPMMRAMAMAPGASAATPIESGNIQVQASVTLTVEVSQ
ncbi:MAG TPA: SIMPL domain-containing protein [Bryobacteraceae bacterium]|nr:SIMPL domain-containing protein [Bryobacteraceae bacterium]